MRTSLIRQSRKVLAADFPEKKIVFDLNSYTHHMFNRTASEIWDFCKRPRSIFSIEAFVCSRHGINYSRAKRDIKKLVAELKKKGLIDIYYSRRLAHGSKAQIKTR